MTKRMLTEFGCDVLGCGAATIDKEFPYKRGWQYVYNFEVKLTQEVLVGRGDVMTEVRTIKIADKHFCSHAHLIEYLTNLTKKGQE